MALKGDCRRGADVPIWDLAHIPLIRLGDINKAAFKILLKNSSLHKQTKNMH